MDTNSQIPEAPVQQPMQQAPAPEQQTVPTPQMPQEAPKANKGWVWAIVIVVILAALAWTGYYYYTNFYKTSSVKTSQTTTAPAITESEPDLKETSLSTTSTSTDLSADLDKVNTKLQAIDAEAAATDSALNDEQTNLD